MLRKNELLRYLELLGTQLKEANLHGEIILTGGASMCLVHSARDMTKDIDALYEPKSQINAMIQSIADQYDLPSDWLNDSVKGFVDENVEIENFMQFENLKVSTVTADYLLAMKLMSSRVEGQDYNDIKFLFRKLGIRTNSDAYQILEKYYPVNRLAARLQQYDPHNIYQIRFFQFHP